MNSTLVDSLDKNTWREFVDRHPQGNIFQTPEMFQVFESACGYHPQLLAAVDDDNRVQALLPLVQVTLMNGPLRRLTTRSIAYGGVLCSSGVAGEKALEILLQNYSEYAAREALFTEIRHLSDAGLIQTVLAQVGYTFEDYLDYLIDLDYSPEQLMQNIGPRTRKHIRQALRREKIIVEEVTDRSQIADWYELIRNTYLTARVPLADRSLFEAAFDILQPRGMVVFWLARLGSAVVAASVELLYKDVIYGWYGGVDRNYAIESPGELLMWCILEWGAIHGYKTYDFGGAGKPSEEYGVRDFKAKFGGKLVDFGRHTCVHAPFALAISRVGYQIYRQMSRHLPSANATSTAGSLELK
jgi:serine/alanine adding enzyme